MLINYSLQVLFGSDLNLKSRQEISQRVGILNHDILNLFISDFINRQEFNPIYLTETEVF